jgi:hypothetical protein
MTWLTWRQLRTQAWAALAVVGALVVASLATAPTLDDLWAGSGMATCGADCGEVARAFVEQVRTSVAGPLYWAGIGVMFVAPALIGAFWGAPLVARELETGTYRLVWNQSVTRGRWLAVKLAFGGLMTVLTVGLLSLVITWWNGPIDQAQANRLLPEIFAARGVVPVGYAAFAFMAGVAVGALIRRTVPAMAVTLLVVAAVQVAMPLWVRPHLLEPVRIEAPLDFEAVRSFGLFPDGGVRIMGEVDEPGAWVLTNRTVTQGGQEFTGPADPAFCGREQGPKVCLRSFAPLNLRQELTYHPASRFWTFQWYETTLFLAVAALLAGFTSWWVRRRLV